MTLVVELEAALSCLSQNILLSICVFAFFVSCKILGVCVCDVVRMRVFIMYKGE